MSPPKCGALRRSKTIQKPVTMRSRGNSCTIVIYIRDIILLAPYILDNVDLVLLPSRFRKISLNRVSHASKLQMTLATE